MSKARILLIQSDSDSSGESSRHLKDGGYVVISEAAGGTGLQRAMGTAPDLILLDLNLPDMDGLEVCRALKSHEMTRSIPVLIMAGNGDEDKVIDGLELGAIDRLHKPFHPKVLMTRVGLVLRAAGIEGAGVAGKIERHGIVLEVIRHEVFVDDKPVELTRTELGILHLLMREAGRAFSREKIIHNVKGFDHNVTDRSVDVHIMGLRRKLGRAGRFVETVRGMGYRFRE